MQPLLAGGPWRLLLAQYPGQPALNVALDQAIGEAVGQGNAPPTVRLWENGQALVLGRFELRTLEPRLGQLLRWAQAHDLALLRRVSGGQLVWHGPGALNYSVCVPRREKYGIHQAYRALSAGVVQALSNWGLESSFGSVAHAYCDGSHNLVINHRKLAGTAQTRRRGFTLVHGTLLVQADLEQVADLISAFYRQAGQERGIRAEALTTLALALGRPLSLDEAKAALIGGYAQLLANGWESAAPTAGELERARQLAEQVALTPERLS